jgi:hypothetical protein
MKNPWPLSPPFRLAPRRVPGPRLRRRVFGLLALVAFLGGWVVDVGGFHGCPHHDLGVEAEAHGHADHIHGDHTHGGHGHEGHSSVAHLHGEPLPPSAPSHSHHDGPCTCRSDCTGAAPVRATMAPTVERAPPAAPVRSLEAAPLLLPARFHLSHVLPWPTAPPRI